MRNPETECQVKKVRVLFLCANNGVQSPMAQGLLNALDSVHFEVLSAGIERGETHPLTIEVMREINIDLEGRATNAAQDVFGQGFDFVITLCNHSRAECPKFPEAEVVHWQFQDPLAAGDHANQKRLFQSLRDQIAQRIRLFALVQVRFIEVAASAHDRRFQTDLIHS
jgi:protein-tyrosine-phosphatase